MSVLAADLGLSAETLTLIVLVLGTAIAYAGLRISKRGEGRDEQSTAATEESVHIQREALAATARRERRDRLEAIKDRGATWEAIADGEGGYFTSNDERLRGQLRNCGVETATVRKAYLELDGRSAVVRTRCDPPQGGGGWASEVPVPPYAVLDLECDLDGIDLRRTGARPVLSMEFSEPGEEAEMLKVIVPLLRTCEAVTGDTAWRMKDIQQAVAA